MKKFLVNKVEQGKINMLMNLMGTKFNG